MDNQHERFVFRKFRKTSWEDEVKTYIAEIELAPNEIWYKSHPILKKINEELIPLGYYAKYEESGLDDISFQLTTGDAGRY